MSRIGALPLEISRRARQDIAQIDSWTTRHFGEAAAKRYANLIAQALADVAASPEGPGTKARPKLMDGVFTYHLSFSRDRSPGGKVKEPRHLLAYRTGASRVEILRVLHDSRDLVRHVPLSGNAE